MKKLFVLFTSTLLVFSTFAQTQKPATPPEVNAPEKETREKNNLAVIEGTMGKLSLQTPVSTKLSEVGDEVNAILYEDVRTEDGRLAIAKGTQFYGHVTQVQRAKKGQKEALLKITFENMLMPYGAEKVVVTVVAIDDYRNDEKYRAKGGEGKVNGGHSGGRTARNAGTGAGIGSIGGIFGGLGGMVIGAGVGAMAGVLMTKGNDLKLDQGTILRIRFEKQLSLPAFEEDRRGARRIENN